MSATFDEAIEKMQKAKTCIESGNIPSNDVLDDAAADDGRIEELK